MGKLNHHTNPRTETYKSRLGNPFSQSLAKTTGHARPSRDSSLSNGPMRPPEPEALAKAEQTNPPGQTLPMAWAGQAAALSWGPYGCFHIPEVGNKLKSCPEDNLVSQGQRKGGRDRTGKSEPFLKISSSLPLPSTKSPGHLLLVGLDTQPDSVVPPQELFNADYTSSDIREPWGAKNKRPTAKPGLAPRTWEVEFPLLFAIQFRGSAYRIIGTMCLLLTPPGHVTADRKHKVTYPHSVLQAQVGAHRRSL